MRTWRIGRKEANARLVVRARDGEEPTLVSDIKNRGSSLAVFPGEKMGPDVIFVLESEAPAAAGAATSSSLPATAASSSTASKLIVVVQSMPDALRTLPYLYAGGAPPIRREWSLARSRPRRRASARWSHRPTHCWRAW